MKLQASNSDRSAFESGRCARTRSKSIDLERERAGTGADTPRERLRALGPEALSDSELVALILRTGGRGCDVFESARAALRHTNGLRGIAAAAFRELEAVPGLGFAKAASLFAAIEIGRRVSAQPLCTGDAIRSAADVHHHFYERLRDSVQENFIAVLLDGRHRVLGNLPISRGTLTASLVHPREVFRGAVREAAAAIVLVHNHPSGDPSPSAQDREVTRRLEEAGEIMGIRVVDHVVVAEGGYYSFCEAGQMLG